MIHPERIILISVMAGVIAAGFTWFGWELFQNLFAVRRNRAAAASAGEQAVEAGAPEKPTQKPAAPREDNKKIG